MRVVDDVLLAALEAVDGVEIHDGQVTADYSTNVVTYPLPYAVYSSSIGDDDTYRLFGRRTRRSVFFSVMYVGLDRNQCKAAGERVRDALEGKRFTFPGHRAWPVELQESQRIRRDDDAIRPDGAPLFYGVDNYAVSITLTHEGATYA